MGEEIDRQPGAASGLVGERRLEPGLFEVGVVLPGEVQIGQFGYQPGLNCGYVYDEALGWPDEGIAPGTRWADVPDEWICPECGSEKRDFTLIDWE